MLPTETPSSLAMLLEDYTDFNCLGPKLAKQVTFLADHRASHNLRVQLVDGAASDASYGYRATTEPEGWPQPRGDEGIVDLTALEPCAQDSVLAVMRAGGFRGKARSSGRPAPKPRQAREASASYWTKHNPTHADRHSSANEERQLWGGGALREQMQ